MTKTASRKLVLSRETLLPLQAAELEAVHGGGTAGAASRATVASAVAASRAAVAASQKYCSAVVNGAKYVADKAVNLSVAAAAKVATDRFAGGGGGGGGGGGNVQ